MFTHAVLFEIAGKEIAKYKKDNLMWGAWAKKARGFISYRTVKRVDKKGEFASVYIWKSKKSHDAFMKKHHDTLVGMSKAKVKVLGYYNMEEIQRV